MGHLSIIFHLPQAVVRAANRQRVVPRVGAVKLLRPIFAGPCTSQFLLDSGAPYLSAHHSFTRDLKVRNLISQRLLLHGSMRSGVIGSRNSFVNGCIDCFACFGSLLRCIELICKASIVEALQISAPE